MHDLPAPPRGRICCLRAGVFFRCTWAPRLRREGSQKSPCGLFAHVGIPGSLRCWKQIRVDLGQAFSQQRPIIPVNTRRVLAFRRAITGKLRKHPSRVLGRDFYASPPRAARVISCTRTATSGRARSARPATRACRPSAPRSTTQECQRLAHYSQDGQRFAQGPHDHHHGTTRSFPRRRCIKAARRFFSFPSRLRTPVLSGARSRLAPRAALILRGPLAPPRFPREDFLTTYNP